MDGVARFLPIHDPGLGDTRKGKLDRLFEAGTRRSRSQELLCHVRKRADSHCWGGGLEHRGGRSGDVGWVLRCNSRVLQVEPSGRIDAEMFYPGPAEF